MKLHPSQAKVAKDNHDYRVVCCGRQWGKTTLSVMEMIACAYSKKNIEIAYFATTYDQARNIAWAMLKDMSKIAWSKPPNESRLELYLKTQDRGVSRITLRGYENVETARGQQFDFLVLDEVAQMKNFDYSWQAILEPTLAFRKGKALFISTPLGHNHFFDMYQRGQGEGNYRSWRFTSYDNPFLQKDRINQAKNESSEDWFNQEYMADFRKSTGIAHKPWDRDIHLIKPFNIPTEWQRVRGFDYGSTHFTASVRACVDNDENWFIDSIYLEGSRSISEHAQAIRAQDYSLGLVPSWGDPSGGQWFTEFDQHNLHIEKANKEVGQGARGWVEYCVEKVNELLTPVPGHDVFLPNDTTINNAPKLFVFDTPENKVFVQQIENLKWRTTSSGDTVPVLDETDDPIKGHYDLMAALRYLAVSYVKSTVPNSPLYKYQRKQIQRKYRLGD